MVTTVSGLLFSFFLKSDIVRILFFLFVYVMQAGSQGFSS